MPVGEQELKDLGAAFLTIGESMPVRREGEAVPDAPNGCFSAGWWRGPYVIHRKGDRMIRMGTHLYSTGPDQHMGSYVHETIKSEGML